MSTIRDVATAAGVSTATVSRVINNDQKYKMKDETRNRVWKAISQTGYKVSYHQAGTDTSAAGENKRVGCIISITKDKFRDPYFMRILSGIEHQLMKKGYSFSFITTCHELSDKQKLSQFFEEPPAGLILMDMPDSETYHYVRAKTRVCIGVDTQYSDIDNVGYDQFETAENATRYLIARGHTKIAFICGGGHTGNVRDNKRFHGYAYAMLSSGLPLRDEWLMDCQWDEKLCMSQTTALMQSENRPTAIFAASDFMAIAALCALYSMEINVPHEISVIGLSNIELSEFVSPPLTTFNVPAFDIGVAAVDLLDRRLQDGELPPLKVKLPTELVVRATVS